MKRKKQIKSQEGRRLREIPTQNYSKTFIVSLKYKKWVGGVKYSDTFMNLFQNSDDYARTITGVLHNILPTLMDRGDSVFKGAQERHCHVIPAEKQSLVLEIAKALHGDVFQGVGSSDSWWQIGFTGGTRIVGIYSRTHNIFYPVFVDAHHLLHPSEKHNQADYKNYTFCPIKNYIEK